MQIHLLKTRLVNSYIVEYQENLLVVDVALGCHEHVAAFITGELGRSLSEVALITCTHDDPDHLGGVKALAQLCGAPVGLPYASKKRRRKLLNDPHAFFFRFFTMFKEAFRPRAWLMYANPQRSSKARAEILTLQTTDQINPVSRVSETSRIKDRQTLPFFSEWQLIHTPGHSWDSCCYYHEHSATLISGDTLLGSRRKGHLVAPAILANPKHLKSSYRQLSNMRIKRVFPGHGSMIEGDHLIHKNL
ncbi:MAG: MBL fold metallo-hydrolase [bacterium]|nr:MBL fold metallo-hydrolase [Gammaproteobacteria bacterium]